MNKLPLRSGFRGSLLGLALGDSLGMPAEYLSPAEACLLFADGIRLLPGRGLQAGQFTDDTLMSIYTLSSILQQKKIVPSDIAARFVQWFNTDDLREIGNTTKEAIRRLKRNIPWDQSGIVGPSSAGNGPAMRVLPVALWDIYHPERLRQDVFNCSIITHQNEEAVAGAMVIAFALQQALRGELKDLLLTVARIVKGTEVSAKLRQANELRKRRVSPQDALPILGTSGYAPETVASALYAFLFFPNSFRDAISGPLIVGGDTDTIAAICGALSGAFLGIKGLPPEWLAGLERKDELDQMAQNLFTSVEAEAL
ncbi:MAG: ADP-ribosylglycohydrolase family protein [Coprothermobacterota bacterium]|nr:ADP-ribosylglycohydrolase family protein [Coprothermobacterota bacterium]